MVTIKLADANAALYQWDTGQRLLITGANAGDRADWIMSAHEPLSTRLFQDNGLIYADIPNILLQAPGSIIVYIYSTVADAGETVACSVLRVRPRPKPDDYIYTETEVETWSALASRVEALEQGGGGSGKPGEAGGYYTPAVEQTAEDTLVIGYNPSKDGMPAVEPVEIDLPPGPPGDSAEATAAALAAAESAEAARAAAEAVENALPGKLDKPEAAPAVGQVLRVLSINDDGTFVCGWDTPQSGGVADVQVAGQSIVSDGVAAIPCVPDGWQSRSAYALYQLNQAYGICTVDTGRLAISAAMEAELSARTSNYKAIVPRNLDKAIKIALCDGKGPAYTDTERLAGLLRLGCTVDDDGFVKWEASAE